MTDAKMTPMLRQYRRLKRQVPDARIGFTCNFGGFGNNVVCLTFVRED